MELNEAKRIAREIEKSCKKLTVWENNLLKVDSTKVTPQEFVDMIKMYDTQEVICYPAPAGETSFSIYYIGFNDGADKIKWYSTVVTVDGMQSQPRAIPVMVSTYNLMLRAAGLLKIPDKIKPAMDYTWHSVYGDDISVLDIYYALYKLYATKDNVYMDLAKSMTTLLCNSFTEEKRDHLFTDGLPDAGEGFEQRFTEDNLFDAYQDAIKLSSVDIFNDMDNNPVFSYSDYRGNKVYYTELAEAIHECGSNPSECVDWIYNILHGLIGSIFNCND